jgi:hypothetical protein
MTDSKFTKLLSDHLLNAKGFYDYGIEHGLTKPEDIRLTVDARKKTARALVDSGMSHREAAKALGVNHTTITRDLVQNAPKSGAECTKSGDENNGTEAAGATNAALSKRQKNKDRRKAALANAAEDDAATVEDEIDLENYRIAFILRADQAAEFAVYSGPIDDDVIAGARTAASAWTALLQKLEEIKDTRRASARAARRNSGRRAIARNG